MQQGDTIRYTWDQNGSYRKITALKVQERKAASDNAPGDAQYSDDRSLMINRSVSLKAAAKIIAHADVKGNLEERTQQTIDIAQRFEQYLLNGHYDARNVTMMDDVPF